ncbi:unnamed protein product [Caenorhabditis bovis]|uniref:Uncharacterized protein n=1 Tax=Caenorhabditis bovis TaxID=2654633 RepID=A0A8S1EWC3_9PELO|nr:unnamed protein product [Caenorhabditis bovis]
MNFCDALVPFRTEDFFDGFYDAYKFDRSRSTFLIYKYVSRTISAISLIVLIFTCHVIVTAKTKVLSSYRNLLICQIWCAFLSGICLSISSIHSIYPFRILITDRISAIDHLPFISMYCCVATSAFLGVFSLDAIIFNFIKSSRLMVGRHNQEEKLFYFRLAYYICAVLFAIIHTIIIFCGAIPDNESIKLASIKYDPRLIEFYAHNHFDVVIITVGWKIIKFELLMTIALITVVFLLFLSTTAYYIKKYSSMTSQLVQTQQKLILRLEIIYALMFYCFLSPIILTAWSIFFYPLEYLKTFPTYFLALLPINMSSFFNCIAQLWIVKPYRVLAVQLLTGKSEKFTNRRTRIDRCETLNTDYVCL